MPFQIARGIATVDPRREPDEVKGQDAVEPIGIGLRGDCIILNLEESDHEDTSPGGQSV